MRAVIIGNGKISDYERIKKLLREDDFIICADGGFHHTSKMNVKADVLLGDFDSIKNPGEIDAEIIKHPQKKESTDGELCVRYAVDNGYDELLLIGMTGTRQDHTLNNILMLFKNKNSYLIDDYNEIYPITDALQIKNKKGKTLSIIPLSGDMEGVTTSGLEYPLNNETLYFGASRGNSNVVTDNVCKISVKKGKGIVIINDGE